MRLLKIFLCLCALFFTLSVYAGAVDVIRNGSFDNGLAEWNLNPRLTSTVTWPLVNGKVNLHPPIGNFIGTVIYQNLNVANIAGKEMAISSKLTKNFSPSGKTVAIYVTYVDNNGNIVRQKVINPDNNTIASGTPVSGTFTFPSTARKLTKIEIAKESYGEFLIDDITLNVEGVTVGSIPSVTSTSASAPYNQNITIQGNNFGSQQGSIKIVSPITGRPVYDSGVNIVSWSDNQITFNVSGPGRSGRIVVVSDYVESNNDMSFELTSPNFTVDFMEEEIAVLKGEKAQFVIKVDLLKGFSTINGIGFMLHTQNALNSVTTFKPTPIKSSGGVLMEIDTKNLSAGTYEGVIKTSENNSHARYAAFKLKVKTVGNVVFKECNYVGSNYVCNQITSKNVTNQGELPYIYIDATDNEGNSIYFGDVYEKINIESSNPDKLLVYKRFGYTIYANDSGVVELKAIAPDGTVVGTLPVNIGIPDSPKVTSLSITPNPVTNKYTDPLSMYASVAGTAGTYGWGIQGNIFLRDDTREWNSNYTAFSGTFKIDHSKTNLGDYLFTVSIGDSKRATILRVTNDPTYSALKPIVKIVDPKLNSYMTENFKVEFYNSSGNLVFSKDFSSYGQQGISIGAIKPDQYYVLVTPPEGRQGLFEPQFYPNSKNIQGAQLVNFGAANTVELPFFLAKKEISPDEQALNNVLDSMIDAYNNKNLTGFMSYVSDNYMDNGENKTMLQTSIQAEFNSQNYTQLTVTGRSIEISGDLATVNLIFAGGNQDTLYFKKENGSWLMYGNQQKYEINMQSHHFANGYYANVFVNDENEKIQSAKISGPGITNWANLTKVNDGWTLNQSVFISQTQPVGDQIYTIQITDKNGITDTYQKKLTGYVNQFATNLAPTGTVQGAFNFSWTGITGAKRYHIELMDSQYGRIWSKYDVSPTQLNTYSVAYAGPNLAPGTYRYFIVSVVEMGGMDNFSFAEGQFTYQVQAPYSISGYVKLSINQTPIQGATVKARNYVTQQIVGETTTNAQGYFKIPISTAGEYEILVEKTGYEVINPPSIPYEVKAETPDVVLTETILMQAVGPESGIIRLNKGWNFVSFPRSYAGTVENAMTGKDIRIIWAYNNENKQWLRWKPGAGNNTLTAIEAGKGYWIYANKQEDINVSTWNAPSSTQVTLYQGWNLVGWLGENGKGLTDALAGLPWVIVWTWENGSWSAAINGTPPTSFPYPPVSNLYQGKAYWINVTTGANWQQ